MDPDLGHGEEVSGGGVHVQARLADLVGRRHVRVEDNLGHGHQRGVRHPRAVVPVPHLTLLVRLHLRSPAPALQCSVGILASLVQYARKIQCVQQ